MPVSERRSLSIGECLPHDFQDWLSVNGVMVRGSLNSRRWQYGPTTRTATPLSRKLIDKLDPNPGYITDSVTLSSDLYPDASGFDAARHLRQLGYVAREAIQDPKSLFVSSLGQGLGIDDLKFVSDKQLITTYMLWKFTGKFVSVEAIGRGIYGGYDKEAERQVLASASGINKLFNETPINVSSANFERKPYFRLEDATDNEESERGPRRYTNILNRNYQEWLREVDLLVTSERDPVPGMPIMLAEQASLTANEAAVVKSLTDARGRIVPTRTIAQRFFGGAFPENWEELLRGRMHLLRDKLQNRDDICTIPDLGFGAGVKALELGKREVAVLYNFWHGSGEFVKTSDIASRTGIAPEAVKLYVKNLRQFLVRSPYEIGTRRFIKGEYIMVSSDDLIDWSSFA